MEFPAELRGEVERLLSEENTDKLAKAAEGISARYRGNDGSGKRLVSSRRALPRTRRISRLTAGSSPA